MIKSVFLLALSAFSLRAYSQKQSITWGDEFKLKKGGSSVSVVYTDPGGVYVQEEHMALKSYFVVGASLRESASLVKLDNHLQEVYKNDFNKELKGKEFESFFGFQDKLLIIASDYNKRDKTMDIYVAEIDKSTGELAGTWKSIANLQKDEKKDIIEFKFIPNSDTSKIVLISTVKGKEKNSFQIQEYDKNFKPTSKPATITNEFEAKTYQLEDVVYTPARQIILVGRVLEYREGKKKKEKFLDFSNYNIRTYDEKGKQLNEINTTINGKWLTSTKLMMGKAKDLVLASFYSKEKKGVTNGLLVQRIDPVTGNVLSTAEKEINYAMITTDNGDADDGSDNDNDSKEERKEREKLEKIKDEGEGFSKYMIFRNIFYTADGGLVLLAENYHHYVYTTTSYSSGSNGFGGTVSSYTNYVYDCGEVLMCKLDANSAISWLEVLPKTQHEVIRIYNGGGPANGLTFYYSFFDDGGRPFYAGFGAMQTNNQICLFFNDQKKNAGVTQPGQKVSSISRYAKSDCYVVTLDEVTGKFQRKVFFSNTDVPTAMPRLGAVIGSDMYIVGKTDRVFGKTKLAVAKITTK